ncbi:prephenate dehydrogenase [Streptomyces viridiviolaceus]|nr:prephenate dehydrogenase [Streptomyces viridiviolaceus]GHB80508.1 prephenate dehydrogenase [Streptomyces viridiviolaceus]
MIRTLAVVGTGLIGTSIGLAMSRRGITVHLVDRDTSAARTAAALGAGVTADPTGPVDLAVIAVPPRAVADVLAEQHARGLARSYTDVASVKALPTRQADAGLPDPSCYVGGHPMAGREQSGPLAARADLFDGRAWVLTPSPRTAQTALNHVLELVALCGAVPLVMDSEVHDQAVALTSHAPHVVASLMAARLQHGPPEALRLVGQGLRDATRIAGGDPRLWADILRSNAAPVARVLRELADDLAELLTALEDVARDDASQDPGTGAVVDLLERGAEGLHAVRPARVRRSGPTLRVTLGETPGELARLLDTVTDHGVGTEDVTTRVDPVQDRMTAEFTVPPVTAGQLRRRLGEQGWQVEGAAVRPTRRPLPQPSHVDDLWDQEVLPSQRVASLPGVS